MRSTRGIGILAALGLTVTVAACGADPEKPSSGPTSSTSTPSATASPSTGPSASSADSDKPVTLTLGVYGSRELVNAYRRISQAYTDIDPNLTVKIKSWPDEDTMVTDIASGGKAPDVFLSPGASLSELITLGLIQPVDSYLDARNVDLGDGYSRTAIEDFSRDKRLQCMPYSVSPQVVYINTDLVDFDAMAKQGLPAPTSVDATSWSLDQFRAAMQFASKPRQGIRGVYVDPTVTGIAPWLIGAGGSLFDDDADPTRTAFADSQDALSQLHPILGNNRFLLPPSARTPSRALSWFEHGKLAAMAGTRALVPTLRKVNGLDWDVMAMPGGAGTTGDYTGLCMSADPSDPDAAADFLTYLISSSAVSKLAKSGSMVPVNQQVAYDDAFLQPNKQPARAHVFRTAVKGMHVLPSGRLLGPLQRAIGPQLQRLLQISNGDKLDRLTNRIDGESQPVFGGPSPSASPTG